MRVDRVADQRVRGEVNGNLKCHSLHSSDEVGHHEKHHEKHKG